VQQKLGTERVLKLLYCTNACTWIMETFFLSPSFLLAGNGNVTELSVHCDAEISCA
jgi:hypothetical protein